MSGAQKRAERSVNYWRGDMWEIKLPFIRAHRGESRHLKRNRARAERRVSRILERHVTD